MSVQVRAHQSGYPWWRLCAACAVIAALVLVAGPAFSRNTRAQEDLLLIEITERDDSGVSGEAELADEAGLTIATVTITAGDGQYLPYLRRGSCKQFREQPAIPLALASTGAPSTTTVDLSLDELTGSYVIALYEIEGGIDDLLDPATAVACGRIVSEESTAATITPPVSGVGVPSPGIATTTLLSICCGAFAFLFGFLGIRQSRTQAVAVAPVHRSDAAAQRLQRYLP